MNKLDNIRGKNPQIIYEDTFIEASAAIAKVSDWLDDIQPELLGDQNTKEYYLAKLKNEMEGKCNDRRRIF